MKKLIFSLFALAIVLASCNPKPADQKDTAANENEEIRMKVEEFVPVKLTTDVSKLTESEKQMIPLMIEAAQIMDKLFWEQAYGDKAQLMAEIQDPWTKKFAEINYGPWERLNGNKPFVKGVGPKPKGACF